MIDGQGRGRYVSYCTYVFVDMQVRMQSEWHRAYREVSFWQDTYFYLPSGKIE